MSRPPASRFALAGICLILVTLATASVGADAPRGASFGRSSLAGSETASMQLETVPARVARVAVRPGTGGREAWALGTTTARRAGWSQIATGQVVFLKYTVLSGWVMKGAPLDRDGKPFNPVLSSFDLGSNGEGWAVGDGGVLLHKAAGSDAWRETSQSRALTPATLNAVSLGANGSGYAVGVGPTILRLSDGSWDLDSPGAAVTTATSELQAVSTVSGDDAWTISTGQVTGVDSTSLLIFRKSGGGWQQVKTNQPIFDSPPAKSPDGELNRSAEAGAVAADANGAWIGGKMYPRSSSNPDGDPTPGDSSRAFVIRIDGRSGLATSYCPDVYSERTGGQVDFTRMCDQPFPTAPFHIASLSIVPGGDVFAGGLGLFRFSGNGWYREPDANGYLISVAFGSNTQGFVASPGRSLGAGGLIRSSTTTIGHWTNAPRRAAVARWPQPQESMLYGIAAAGDASGRAIAVGADGAASLFSGTGWDSIRPEIGYALRGVAWPAGDTPWAVGQNGFILHLKGLEWQVTQAPVRASLHSVAFRSRDEGVAVGLGGTILVYRGGEWRDESPASLPQDLYDVVTTDDGYVIAGAGGTVVEGAPGAWRVRSEVRGLLKRPESNDLPALYSVTRWGDRVVAGGQDSALVVREANGSYRNLPETVQGTVLSVTASDRALYASVSPNADKWRGEAAATQRATVMRLGGGVWSDVGLGRRATILRDNVDTSQFDDPIYDLAVTDGDLAWGAGGSPADLKDTVEGHFRSTPTSAVYKISFGEDPTFSASKAAFGAPKPGIRFAAFGESWCGTGFCSSGMGTGMMADLVALQIRDEINDASTHPGGPTFVVYTGNMRRTGVPDELHEFRRFIQGFRIPVYASIGSLDRFMGIDVSHAGGASTGVSSGSNDYWKSIFASQPAPWGTAKAPPGFKTVESPTAPLDGLARTHYAFDVLEGGKPALRVVMVDSSTRSYGTADEQNPQEDQRQWLKTVLTDSATVARIPSIVVMNQPTILPSDQQPANWTVPLDQQDFETVVSTLGVTAVITGGARLNGVDTLKGLTPLYIVGGGGAPLGRDANVQGQTLPPPSKLPTDGYYHAWHLMTVNTASENLQHTGHIDDDVYPILESLAMHSEQGSAIVAGNTTNITAIARGLNGGFADPDQSKATYIHHGEGLYPCGYKGQGEGRCISGSALLPRFRFYSEDPTIAEFVKRSPYGLRQPAKYGPGKPTPDPDGTEGLLCAYKLGKVGINAVAGSHRTRMEITVVPGKGPCIDVRVQGVRIVRPPVPSKPPATVEDEPFYPHPRVNPDIAIVFPPPPAPVVAPAPPGAPGVGRKEEHEVEYETEKHEHEFTALVHARRTSAIETATAQWSILGAVALFALFGAVTTVAVRRREAAPHAVQRWR
jgi:hypothetical protein